MAKSEHDSVISVWDTQAQKLRYKSMLIDYLRRFIDLKFQSHFSHKRRLIPENASVWLIGVSTFISLIAPAQAGQLYKWKNAQGRVFYSDQQPPVGVKNAKLATLSASTLPSQAPIGRENVKGRQVVVTVLSWYSPLGALNGSKWWRQDGYKYEDAKASNGVKNYPLTSGITLPVLGPKVGSDEFHTLQYQAALEDLRQMRMAGFDVAAFDMLPMPAFNPKKPLDSTNTPFTHYETFLQWLKAGEAVGMKVALFADIKNHSADYPKGYTLDVQEWVNALGGGLDNAKSFSSLWRLDGKPVIIHFGTDVSSGAPPMAGDKNPDGGWRYVLKSLRESGRSFYFIADVRPNTFGGVEVWSGLADAVHIFAPASTASYLSDTQTAMSSAYTVPYMWSVSPGYYNAQQKIYTEPDFRRIHDTYVAAMKSGAKLINVLTWNDFGEDTDIAPSANKGRALLDIFSYYNNWFKWGAPPLTKVDEVILAYPTRIPTKVQSFSRSEGPLKELGQTYAPKVFYWANIKTGRTLEVAGVGKVKLPSGLSMGELGMATPSSMLVNLGGYSKRLPIIRKISSENQQENEGGLEYSYVIMKP